MPGNLWWCRNHEAISLTRRINPDLREKTGQNPVAGTTLMIHENIPELSQNARFLVR